MKKLKSILDRFIEWEKLVCITLLVIMLVICFAQVVMRYVFNKPFAWSEEVILILLIWFGFICMSIDIRSDSHIAITGVYSRLPLMLQKACDLLRHVLLCGFFFLMVKYGWQVYKIADRKRLPASRWSQGWQFLPMVIGGAIMLIFSVINLIKVFVKEKNGEGEA